MTEINDLAARPVDDDELLSPMKAVLLMPPVLIPELREPLVVQDGEIHFLAIYLLHQDELDLKLNDGLERLFAAFTMREVTELYDLQRPSVLM